MRDAEVLAYVDVGCAVMVVTGTRYFCDSIAVVALILCLEAHYSCDDQRGDRPLRLRGGIHL